MHSLLAKMRGKKKSPQDNHQHRYRRVPLNRYAEKKKVPSDSYAEMFTVQKDSEEKKVIQLFDKPQ